jgi:hypothetical protein
MIDSILNLLFRCPHTRLTRPVTPINKDGLDAPHAVQEKHQNSPEGDELEAPFGKMIVTRGRLVAA